MSHYDVSLVVQNIGMVSQEPCLFNGTIRENILLGRKWEGKGTTEERLIEAAGIAQAATFIRKLEHVRITIISKLI